MTWYGSRNITFIFFIFASQSKKRHTIRLSIQFSSSSSVAFYLYSTKSLQQQIALYCNTEKTLTTRRLPVSKSLVTVGRKIFLLTVRNLRENQAQGGTAIWQEWLGIRGERQDKRRTVEESQKLITHTTNRCRLYKLVSASGKKHACQN